MQSKTLTFLYDGKKAQPSLDPDESDIIRNAIVMEQLVGTLVKERHGNTGRSEPYLAEKWQVTPDGKVWDFYFHSDLEAEDHSPIDAKSFSISLKTRLRLNATQHDLPAFNLLLGWKTFLQAEQNDLAGLQVISPLHLRFEFSARPAGLLEYLAMPTYGHFCPSNYANKKWKDKYQIISSGPYRLLENNTDGIVRLEHKKSWKLSQLQAPERIEYRYGKLNETLAQAPKSSIAVTPYWPSSSVPDGFTLIPGSPMILGAVILSAKVTPPSKSLGLFHNLEARRIFKAQLAALQKNNPFKDQSAIFDSNFYLNAPQTNPNPSILNPFKEKLLLPPGQKKVLIHGQAMGHSPAYDYLQRQVQEVFRLNGIESEMIGLDTSAPNWLQERNNPEAYDVRLATVDIGGYIENWVIKMMFCSTLGVNFPDPSGRICALTSKIEENPASLSEEAYAFEFNQILNEDCAVLPSYHFGFTWIAGNELDLTHASPSMMIPRVELFKFK